MKDPELPLPKHILVYDPTWARQVLASGDRPLRWRCRSCGLRFPTRRGDELVCQGPTVVELPSEVLRKARGGRL